MRGFQHSDDEHIARIGHDKQQTGDYSACEQITDGNKIRGKDPRVQLRLLVRIRDNFPK